MTHYILRRKSTNALVSQDYDSERDAFYAADLDPADMMEALIEGKLFVHHDPTGCPTVTENGWGRNYVPWNDLEWVELDISASIKSDVSPVPHVYTTIATYEEGNRVANICLGGHLKKLARIIWQYKDQFAVHDHVSISKVLKNSPVAANGFTQEQVDKILEEIANISK